MTLAAIVISAFACLSAMAADKPSATKPIDFAHDVAPLLKVHCAKCHTDGTYKGSFSLDTRETMLKSKAVVPGKSGESELIERITSDDPELRMPPKGARLTASEVARLKIWIDQKTPWDAGFSFKRKGYVAPLKLRRPALPVARDGRDHPIDRLVDAYFASHGVSPPAPLSDGAFARRAFLDVIGLLPPPRELEAFEKDQAPDKRARLIRRLLRDRRAYADHWLSFWNDLLRNDYVGTGYIDGGRKQITTWLYRALLDDLAVRPFCPRADQSQAGSGGVHQGDQVARARQRQPGPRDPVLAERLAGVLRHQHEMCVVPRQLHRSVEAHGRLRARGRDRRRAARDRPLRQADRQDRRAHLSLA